MSTYYQDVCGYVYLKAKYRICHMGQVSVVNAGLVNIFFMYMKKILTMVSYQGFEVLAHTDISTAHLIKCLKQSLFSGLILHI